MRPIAILTLATLALIAAAADPTPDSPGWGAEPVVEQGPKRGEIVLNGLWKFMPAMEASADVPTDEWGWMFVPNPWTAGWSNPGSIVRRPATPLWTKHYQPGNGAQLDVMWFQRSVAIPAAWDGRAILVDLRWIGTDAEVYIGDQRQGTVSWPTGLVDVTAAVRPGATAELRIKVYANAQEGFTLSTLGIAEGMQKKEKAQVAHRGLIGDVLLRSRPKGGHVSDVFVQTSTRKKRIDLAIEVAEAAPGPLTITAAVKRSDGTVAKTFTGKVTLAAREPRIAIGWDWADPVLWDCGKPNLYTIELGVKGAGIDDVANQRFGFREFWIDGRNFMLNGTPFRPRLLHPAPSFIWDIDLVRQGLLSQQKAGFNLLQMWPNAIRRGDQMRQDLYFGVADEIGMPMLGAVGHVGDLLEGGQWSDQAKRSARWTTAMTAVMRRCRNHPSVLMWGHSGNVFAYPQDLNPLWQGARGMVQDPGWLARAAIGEAACADVRALDPTRPVYTHHGGYVGDWHTINHYLNFIPLQEREEWCSWSVEHAQMPWTPIEFGVPDPISFHRGRRIFFEALATEPWGTEFAAIYLGRQAYALETDAQRSEIIRAHKGGDAWWGAWPMQRRFAFAPNIQRLIALFTTNTWRSWRGAGHTGGMLPWSDGAGWEWPNPNPGDPRPWDPPAAERVVKRPFVPGALGPHPTECSTASVRPFDPDLHPPTPAGVALMANNGPTLAYLAGAPDLAEKSHLFTAGATVRKQAMLINDERDPQTWTVTMVAELGGATIGKVEQKGTIAVGRNATVPFAFTIPAKLAGAKVEGVITLTATIGQRRHEDRFPFRAFAPTPAVGGEVAIVDPVGRTTALLKALGVKATPWDGGAAPLLVVGREALGAAMPGDLAAYVRAGGKLLIMTQDPELLRGCGWRVSRHVTRRAFPVDGGHAMTTGLDAEDLRDWAGASTLIPARSELPATAPLPSFGWRWGNRGAVASAAIEKPHLSGWRPVIECEFDLQYSPLMTLAFGAGQVVLCTLDLEDAVAAGEPSARRLAGQILTALRAAKPAPRRPVTYVGGEGGQALLARLGVTAIVAQRVPAEPKLVVVGGDAAVDDASLRACLAAGGRVLLLARPPGAGPFGTRIEHVGDVPAVTEATMNQLWSEAQMKSLFAGSLAVPAWPEAGGLSPSDTRFKTFHAADLLRGGTGVELGADGLLGRVAAGPGVAILCQLAPDALGADQDPTFRFTRWRHTRALAQLLANLGAELAGDAAIFARTPSELPLPTTWKAALLKPLPAVSEWKERRQLSPISPEAQAAMLPGFDDGAWKPVAVPCGWDAYGPEWAAATGEAAFRTTLRIPATWAGKDLILDLGNFDPNANKETVHDQDDTFFNGVRIGGDNDYWARKREYPVPAKLVTVGDNLLAVRVFSKHGIGGIKTPIEALKIRFANPPERPALYHPDYRTGFADGDEPYRWVRW